MKSPGPVSACEHSEFQSTHVNQPDLFLEPEPGPSQEPHPGPSTEHQPGSPRGDMSTQSDSDNEASSDLCHTCFLSKDDEWIQCDSCNKWFHRKCAGLKNKKQWNRLQKEGVLWYCKVCK